MGKQAKDARKANKQKKQNYKDNLSPNDKRNLSDSPSDSSDNESKTTSSKPGYASRPQGANNKKLRTFDDEKDMDEVFAESSNNSQEFFDAENTLPIDANLGSTPAA